MPPMTRVNDWRQETTDYWACMYYDVWRHWGRWYASFIYGQRFPQDFETAEEAMKWVDAWDKETRR
jgi:hypothetical protein